ncbi:MAG: NAD(+) kinase [Candidatus Omnitrophica bacterium CG11_big_fil_rev_8_21_14_0_20_45_26]|uniref:NAD kinase n=1 Tax=Candidatus Abzuiibacterium crystallinum TaxID=1974748 RepID=A0A2H0LPZ6_9BACT|nr:MAG: NAD(+) kinase [Candidatus Omnitrophica bacterium CG11_big_fil_rev_8_21_14_0_20_45_26]PIW65623.1 MAG: NAD(+) kinase [Candidatus Omnitrophica bacterium CG12_big_fil_rev_8_21_14_0_65_45_16]
MNSHFKKIGIITTFSKKPAVESCRQNLRVWLEKRDIQILDGTELSVEKVISEADLIVSLGGDGAILRLAGKMIDRLVPVLGVNLGSLGFLTEVKVDEFLDELKSILLGRYEIEERLMLSCAAKSSQGGQPRRFQALNDLVINREGLTRYMQVEFKLNNETVTRFSGDGLIVATPTGSTAYSLSAGGPIVHPELDDIIVTPICPHASALRSVLVPADKKIEIKIECDQEQDKALLTADGQDNLEIDKHYTIEITAAQNKFPLIKSSKRSYFGTLREKFKFPI